MTDLGAWTRERKEALLAEMAKTRPHRLPVYDYLLDKVPDFMEAAENMYTATVGKPGGYFPEKMRELFIILTMSAQAFYPDGFPALKNHIRKALDQGLKEEEILEALTCTVPPGSMKNFMLSATLLMEVVNERKG